jgi:transcriptional regulator with XRE-family HTH domain
MHDNVSALEDTSSVFHRGRAEISAKADSLRMSDVEPQGDWRERLRQTIKAQNTSMRKVSLDAGLGPGAVHSWLSAPFKDPSVTHLMDVCKVLKVSVIWITKGYDLTPEAEEILSLLENDPAGTDSVLTLLRGRSGG